MSEKFWKKKYENQGIGQIGLLASYPELPSQVLYSLSGRLFNRNSSKIIEVSEPGCFSPL